MHTRSETPSRTKDMSINFGNSKAFLEFLIALAIVGLAISLGTRRWDYWLAIGSIAILVIASPLALLKAWKDPGNSVYLVSLLPSKWRRWIAGEPDPKSNKNNLD